MSRTPRPPTPQSKKSQDKGKATASRTRVRVLRRHRSDTTVRDFVVIGFDANAADLGALRTHLDALKDTGGLAFTATLHLDPSRLSTLTELLSKQWLIQTDHDTAPQTGTQNRLRKLTRRERDVLALLVSGHHNKEIAAQLGISQRTVENHRAHIREKTGCRSLAELVHLANGVLSHH